MEDDQLEVGGSAYYEHKKTTNVCHQKWHFLQPLKIASYSMDTFCVISFPYWRPIFHYRPSKDQARYLISQNYTL